VRECSECCITREYYPDKRFGKIGVLILPEERDRIQKLADDMGVEVMILPRIGVSGRDRSKPDRIIAYQMMGRDLDGNTCPFLDTKSGAVSPHGGYPCRIYEQRPLACAAYPLNSYNPVTLDEKCQFCKECGTADQNLESEIRSLIVVERTVSSDAPLVWRFATGVGEEKDRKYFEHGWILDEDSSLL